MNKSIEEIWSEGFDNNNFSIPPVIVNLYDKKSILTIDKLKAASKKDNWSIIPMALIVLIFFIIKSKVIFGLYFATLMMSLFFLNRKRLQFLNTINTDQSCFEYLSKIQKMIKDNVKFYTRLLGIGFPFLASIGYCLFILGTDQKDHLLETYSINTMITSSIILLMSFSIIGVLSFRLSNYLIYGRLIKKIDEMIEELALLTK